MPDPVLASQFGLGQVREHGFPCLEPRAVSPLVPSLLYFDVAPIASSYFSWEAMGALRSNTSLGLIGRLALKIKVEREGSRVTFQFFCVGVCGAGV